MHLLLLTVDPLLVSAFTEISTQMGVEAQSVGDFDGFSHRLSSAKYEGVVLDFDTVSAAIPAFGVVRKSSANTRIVVFAVATDAHKRDRALQDGAHFLLQRPIDRTEIRRMLDVAYDLMLGERRRYFRYPAELPVLLRFTTLKTSFQCLTMNVSSNGMAVRTPVPLRPAETMDIELVLPETGTVRAIGIVVWYDQRGECGLKVQCSSPEMRKKLDSWLDSQLRL